MGILRSAARRLPPKLKGFIKASRVSLLENLENKAAVDASEKAGRPCPSQAAVKHVIIQQYARLFGIDTFVETGTCAGDTVNAVRRCFKQIVSIELSPVFYLRAAARFANYGHIRILQGDSGALLPEVLAEIRRPVVFWLDAHETGGEDTARGDKASPIMEEMDAIFAHPIRDHVILIDDVPDFSGERDGIPVLDVFRDYVLRQRPGWTFEVTDSIIRIHPSCRQTERVASGQRTPKRRRPK